MDFKDSLTFRIARLATFHRIELERRLAVFGIHAGQILVLFELWDDDGLSQIELVTRIGLSGATINRMVKSLAANGFVEMTSCVSDGRLKRAFLTAKGESVKAGIAKAWVEMEKTMLSGLTSTEKLILGELADKISTGADRS